MKSELNQTQTIYPPEGPKPKVCVTTAIRERQRRRLRQRQRHKARIARISEHFFCRTPQNNNAKSPNFRFRRQRKHITMNYSFSIFTLKPFIPIRLQDSSLVLYKVINLTKRNDCEIHVIALWYILEWRFRCRRPCLNALLSYHNAKYIELIMKTIELTMKNNELVELRGGVQCVPSLPWSATSISQYLALLQSLWVKGH